MDNKVKEFHKSLLKEMEALRILHSIKEGDKIEYLLILNKNDVEVGWQWFLDCVQSSGEPSYKSISKDSCLMQKIMVASLGGGLFTIYATKGIITSLSIIRPSFTNG